MNKDRKMLEKTLAELSAGAEGFSLPEWEELPDIELYMDQVLTLISKYLSMFNEVSGAEKLITPSMINNYVKLGTIPPPVKKRYSRVHMAYLLVVCSLKQTLDMSTIKRLMPVGMSEEETRVTYNSFVVNQKRALSHFTRDLNSMAKPILNENRSGDLVMQVAASASIFKILTERICAVPEEEREAEAEGGAQTDKN